MINNVLGGSFVTVSGGSGSTYVNGYNGAQGVGNMRYNTTMQRIEVYDGNNWIQLAMPDVMIDLNPETQSLLAWARKKRDQEQELERLVQNYPALADARENLERAQEQLDMLATLARDDKLNATR
jgi:hypothetical protein